MALNDQHPDLVGITEDTVLDTFIFAGDDHMVRDVWSAGRHHVTEGRHIQRDTIVQRYSDVMKSLRTVI